MSTQVILLEKVESLGQLGDVVNVKPGYARNFLLPQKKALRATKQNVAYFEAQKKTIQSENDNKKKDAEKLAKNIDALKVPLIRQASESGQLYGSVTTRDIAAAISETSGETLNRSHVQINRNFKMIGLFAVDVALHPEVIVQVTINIARSPEEAQIQAETGRALVSSAADDVAEDVVELGVADDENLAAALEDDALEAVKEQEVADKEAAEEAAAKAAAKPAKKKKVKATEEETEATAMDVAVEAPTEDAE